MNHSGAGTKPSHETVDKEGSSRRGIPSLTDSVNSASFTYPVSGPPFFTSNEVYYSTEGALEQQALKWLLFCLTHMQIHKRLTHGRHSVWSTLWAFCQDPGKSLERLQSAQSVYQQQGRVLASWSCPEEAGGVLTVGSKCEKLYPHAQRWDRKHSAGFTTLCISYCEDIQIKNKSRPTWCCKSQFSHYFLPLTPFSALNLCQLPSI